MLDQGRIQGGGQEGKLPPLDLFGQLPQPPITLKRKLKKRKKWGREGKKMKEKEKRRKYQ